MLPQVEAGWRLALLDWKVFVSGIKDLSAS
jgi:hypothetical protein